MYVLDTNTLIYFFKGMGNVAERLFRESPRDIGIPSIVLFELEVGIAKTGSPTRRSKQLREALSVVSILDFGMEEARSASRIRAHLETRGRPIGPYDVLIAGTAAAHRATLVTHNIKEFSQIEGLSIEDLY